VYGWISLPGSREGTPPDSSDTQTLNALTDEEMGRLVSIASEEFGRELTRTQFNDVMLALFEHIAGLETLLSAVSIPDVCQNVPLA